MWRSTFGRIYHTAPCCRAKLPGSLQLVQISTNFQQNFVLVESSLCEAAAVRQILLQQITKAYRKIIYQFVLCRRRLRVSTCNYCSGRTRTAAPGTSIAMACGLDILREAAREALSSLNAFPMCSHGCGQHIRCFAIALILCNVMSHTTLMRKEHCHCHTALIRSLLAWSFPLWVLQRQLWANPTASNAKLTRWHFRLVVDATTIQIARINRTHQRATLAYPEYIVCHSITLYHRLAWQSSPIYKLT